MRLHTAVLGVAMAGLGLLGTAGQAQAVGWGTIVSSLGSGYGDFYNEGSSFARTNAHYKDNRPGGAPVYVRTRYQFYYQNCSAMGCNPSYTPGTSRTTSRTTSASYVYAYTHNVLDSLSDRARGQINVCQDEAFTYDPCSDTTAYPSFAY
ncbi:hypothetical protein [Pedococcus sp. 5OH_020]|uniref:hypothetical protein n=1 Tax=Pedococcus sp. 5OH_020 TaxID=2989814 RepID=UPI0022EA0F42|nr:hypothetical protein [Pedococcus sp. 5OH_020]